ncbi:hypothetical protein A2841_03945 [Candidatus Kaiserbacteria bacterium RIFCSPHIGHO2_01_FULL_48_10]|uniref:Uncharacterized protein n=1 Tax=Candidatus Kaiserbacteria bacterium RIFCSPHIGHO2_01_FULL_48_10 TaxID=1798476 RepID=A0A1F6C4K6_9BACT|nr:MAG: hypothetical protein A2841_03945 [Candidatus Kaiserbacteria bacterium RIFCSPHIGHO2_01_FULL_48_10]
MDQMNQNAPQMNSSTPMPPASPTPKEGNLGGMIAIIVIVGLLLAGGWYYFTQVKGVLDQEPVETTLEEQAALDEQVADEQSIQNLGTQSSSDDTSSIEADVNATDLSGIDNTAASINADFQAQ